MLVINTNITNMTELLPIQRKYTTDRFNIGIH